MSNNDNMAQIEDAAWMEAVCAPPGEQGEKLAKWAAIAVARQKIAKWVAIAVARKKG